MNDPKLNGHLSDTKNSKILLEFARLGNFMYEAARYYFSAEDEHLRKDPLHMALLWVLWMVSDYGRTVNDRH
jgi:hypothetical protein